MSGLKDLLFSIRQHPCFQELLNAVEAPPVRSFKLSEDNPTQEQTSEWIYRSGRQQQNKIWRDFLTDYAPPQEDET